MQTVKTRLVKLQEVEQASGLSKTTLYRLMRTGHFPEPLQVGPKAVRWRADEIQAWVDSRPRARGESSKAKAGTSCR